MWKSIKNISKAVKAVTVIGVKEVSYQLSKMGKRSEENTKKLADKADMLKESYEERLEARKISQTIPATEPTEETK